MNKRALIFGGIIIGAIVLIALGVWFASLFQAEDGQTNEQNDLFSSLFPFGFGGGNDGGNAPQEETGDGTGESGPVPLLREVTPGPVSGARFQTNGSLRYVERETGHVFETETDSLAIVRISNTTIPGIERIIWVDDTRLILQYLDEADTLRNYLGSIPTSTPDQSLTGKFLGGFSDALTASATQLVTLTTDGNGSRFERVDIDGPGRTLLFQSSLRGWKLLESANPLLIETAPASDTGYVYRVRSDQSLERVIGATPGLLSVSNEDGSWVAYSSTAGDTTRLLVLERETGKVAEMLISTLARKCAWLPGEAPVLFCGVPSAGTVNIEGWFMGLSGTSDDAWILNAETGVAQIVANLATSAGRPIDLIDPMVSPDGAYAVFTNKNDLSLWSLKLEQ